MPARTGTTQELAALVDSHPLTCIADVTALLTEIHAHASTTTTAGERDGIACFTLLYREITKTVDASSYQDRPFLERLDVEFARRYVQALQQFARSRELAPRPWRLLFDMRSDPDVEPVQFAAAGVNAHINRDLAPALLETWAAGFPPDDEGRQRQDFDVVNDVFARHMDPLRELFGAAWAEAGVDGDAMDWIGNRIGNLLVRRTRANAWDDAWDVWHSGDRGKHRERLERELEFEAGTLAVGILRTPLLQWFG